VVAVVVAREARQRTEKGAKPNAAPAKKYPVTIRKPAGPPTVKTGLTDYHGNPVSVSCGTCHATRPANAEARLGVDLPSFHQGFKGNHGSLACIACHNPSDGYQTLRLADGRSVPYSEVMQLCAQCHGPQYRDYQRGAHGGMTGYWDLSRGPRARNNCIDCHDPHTPRYPAVRPAPGPNDRFLHDARKGAAHE
jgi:hypothetical protein